MKILLRKNIAKLGRIGDVVEVKPGYARNYLFPQRLAVKPTKGNLKAVEAEKQHDLEQLARERTELQQRARLLSGKEITIPARANEEGNLYGSIGPAQIVAVLASESFFLEPENIVLDEPIRQLDKYDVQVRFAEDVTATIHVWVVPHHEADEAPVGEADRSGPTDEPGEDPKPDAPESEGFEV